jgi:demethylmenaquinone methyltransferase/2-methoxy-6-polyprenyl-1,4-benzoquinol methylase
MVRGLQPRKPFDGWDGESLRAPHNAPHKAARVEAMFDAIAPTYERVNTVATLGRDAVWRRKAVAAADVRATDIVLDVCCGTGDMVRHFARLTPSPTLVIGVDFAARMLAAGDFRGEHAAVQVVRADALRLPLADATVDVVSCTFGVRNFADLQAGLEEMGRVARPGARVVVLEFTQPASRLMRWAYAFYCERVLPRLGGWISGDRVGAYRYLPRSIYTFESAEQMARRLEDAGFGDLTLRRMNFGGVVLYRGVRRGAACPSGVQAERTDGS